MVDEFGGWDWCRLSPWLSKDTLEKITAVMPPQMGLGTDRSRWRWKDNCNFTTRSAYSALSAESMTNGSERCSVCDNGTESIEHVLRVCPQARQVWETMLTPDKLSVFDSLPFDTWLLQCFKNIARIGVGDDKYDCNRVCGCACVRERYQAVTPVSLVLSGMGMGES
ncbi:hypothetical protein V6N12_050825 [Hibiscus sabdariffa]|uniref:Reverse transcriptase zinc-binding domain-containing protein n=1 Tax=Hibiscus sabdariffa TaxID=183260 RepID=A0ABR2GDY3_9ROSI